jgi:uncharacterized protein with WD repeat
MEKQPLFNRNHSFFVAIALCLTLATTPLLNAQTDVFNLNHDNNRVRELVFSPNGKILVAKSGDEVQNSARGIVVSPSIHLWDIESKRKTLSTAHREIGRASAISQDGSMIAYKEKNSIEVMDLTSRKIVSTIKLDDSKFARPIAFCNERRGVVVEQGNKCTVFDVQAENARAVREYNSPGINHYIFNDDSYVVEAFGDSFRLVDFKSGLPIKDFALLDKGKSEALRSLVISPENRFIATLSENKVRIWDTKHLTELQSNAFPIQAKDAIYAFSADGRYLFGGLDTLKIWEIKTRKEIVTPITAEGKISAVTVSPDGKLLACGDTRGNIKVWELSDENLSELYFAREIQNEVSLIKPRGEFEKTDEYNKRRQKHVRGITAKYMTSYFEKISSEPTLQEQKAAIDDEIAQANIDKRRLSRRQIDFTIDSISTYDADREVFKIKMVNAQEKYAKWETVKVPTKDNPSCFKQKSAQLKVVGTIELTEDMRGYDIYNIRIKSNCVGGGKEKDYPFGKQRQYLESEEDTNTGKK